MPTSGETLYKRSLRLKLQSCWWGREGSFLPAIADEKMKTTEQLSSYVAWTYPAFYSEQVCPFELSGIRAVNLLPF
jgi:hypothetical protein